MEDPLHPTMDTQRHIPDLTQTQDNAPMTPVLHNSRLTFCLLCSLFACLSHPPLAAASSFSYGYAFPLTQTEPPSQSNPAPGNSRHQINISDGYCIFSYEVFDRVCFELGLGFRFPNLQVDLAPQATFQILTFHPIIYGWFFTLGPLLTLGDFSQQTDVQLGLKAITGFHIYFVALSAELHTTYNTLHQFFEARVFFQVTLIFPTGSINFLLGNSGF